MAESAHRGPTGDSQDPSTAFDPVDLAMWEAAAEKALRGRPLESLTTTTAGGVARSALYTPGIHSTDDDPAGLPGDATRRRGARASSTLDGWDIRQSHDLAATSPGAANAAILADLERGATSITLVHPTAADLTEVLAGVYLDLAGVHLAPGADPAAVEALRAVAAGADGDIADIGGGLGLDPIGDLARAGGSFAPIGDAMTTAATIAADVVRSGAATHPITVDGPAAGGAGASDSQEIAYILSCGVAYLRALTDEGLTAAEAASALAIDVAVDADQFATIAKLRALRQCWARVCAASGAADATVTVHARTSASMITARDPWVNMLRTTTATFAAAVGGADAISVTPFDAGAGVSDDFARRIARNTQAILSEESQLGRVIDPAGGSWYVESLTDELAAAAWKIFQSLEADGGVVASLLAGGFQDQVGAVRAGREAALATRKQAVTGVSEFPDVHEEMLVRPARPTDGAPPIAECAPLEPFRSAEVFEALRSAADDAAQRPTIFLANLGPIAEHNARAGFAKNLFEVGGIEALGNDGFDSAAEAASAFTASSARIACICSSDRRYGDHAGPTAAALKEAGAELVFLAGAPGDHEQEWRTSGVDGFISMGCDIVAVLTQCHEVLL